MVLLTQKEMKPHWKWVDDGDGYNQRQEFNIKTLLEAQLKKVIEWYEDKGEEKELGQFVICLFKYERESLLEEAGLKGE